LCAKQQEPQVAVWNAKTLAEEGASARAVGGEEGEALACRFLGFCSRIRRSGVAAANP